MKKFIAIAAVVAMICLVCAACGCSNSAPATTPTVRPTVPTTIPATLPTMETNIPDPEVNDNSTVDTLPTDITGTTENTVPARNRSMNRGAK